MIAHTFILASQSPQRKKILTELGLSFKVHPADIDEHHAGYKNPHAIVKSIALRKALTVADVYPKDWVIGCDTIVFLSNGKIALKPSDQEEARQTLMLYKNSYCHVYSGLALVNLSQKVSHVEFEKTTLYFSDLSQTALDKYLSTGHWKDRSGSLTIEEKIDWIKHVDGDYWNVVGLPVQRLKKMLKNEGLV